MDIPITTPSVTPALRNSVPKPAFLGSKNTICCREDGSNIGTLGGYASEVLAKLSADDQIELQLDYTTEESGKTQRKTTVCSLQAILYGPGRLADDVGDFITKCGYFLQDPLGCAKNVPYLNPQRLSSLDGCLPMTFELHQEQHLRVDEFTRAANDILANFETTEVLAQTETPSVLRTKLQV